MFFSLVELAFRNLLFFVLHVERNGTFPRRLTKEEEKICLKEIAQGSHCARNRLIEHNLRLVAYIVKKHYPDSPEQEDLISIGTFGLINAVGTFKPDKKTSFSTYASKCIDNQIKVGGLLRGGFFQNGGYTPKPPSANGEINSPCLPAAPINLK